jgi:hypothetical protein
MHTPDLKEKKRKEKDTNIYFDKMRVPQSSDWAVQRLFYLLNKYSTNQL